MSEATAVDQGEENPFLEELAPYQKAHSGGPFPLRAMLTEESLLEAFLYLWQELLRHDEVARARKLIESCPWRIRHRPEITLAAKTTAEVAAHLESDGAFFRFYADRMVQIDLPHPPDRVEDDDPQAVRLDFVNEAVLHFVDECQSGPKRLLDVGCQDGWMLLDLLDCLRTDSEIVGVGIDMMPGMILKARDKATQMDLEDRTTFLVTAVPPPGNFPPELASNFNVVICTEVVEHVRSEIDLFDFLAVVTAPGGLLVMTAPEGSWFRGSPYSMSPPWYCPREHVRAVTARELALALAPDFEILRSEVIPMPKPEVPGQAMAGIVARRRG